MLRPGFFGETFMDDFFNDFAYPTRGTAGTRAAETNIMKTDVQELDDGYALAVELPGYKKEDVQAELKNGNLIITANHSEQSENGEDKYIRRERFWGSCSRSFYVGEDIKQQDIKAKFEDGVLKLFVPKKEEAPQVEKDQFICIEG
jgi:HSP20 family molecular chaperone IbpA